MGKHYILDVVRVERTHAYICVEAESAEEAEERLHWASDKAERIFDGATGYAVDFEVDDAWEASPAEVEECRFETIQRTDV